MSACMLFVTLCCPDPPCQHPITQVFTGWMPFLPPNQQRQSTEGKISAWFIVVQCMVLTLGSHRTFYFQNHTVSTQLPIYCEQNSILSLCFAMSLSDCGGGSEVVSACTVASSKQMISKLVWGLWQDTLGSQRRAVNDWIGVVWKAASRVASSLGGSEQFSL